MSESVNPLYSGIVAVDQIPNLRNPFNGREVSMAFEDDNTLLLNERIVILRGHKLFIFNALLMNLGRSITRRDIEALGFAPGNAPSTRPKTLTGVKISLEQNLIHGIPPQSLIQQKYDSKKTGYFQLDPNIGYTFTDRRQEK